MEIILNNAKNTPLKIMSSFKQDGEIKTRPIFLAERAIGVRVCFVNEDEKTRLMPTLQELEGLGKIIISKQAKDKEMQKANEKLLKQEGTNAKEKQELLDQNIQQEVENETQGNVPDFKINVSKGRGKGK